MVKLDSHESGRKNLAQGERNVIHPPSTAPLLAGDRQKPPLPPVGQPHACGTRDLCKAGRLVCKMVTTEGHVLAGKHMKCVRAQAHCPAPSHPSWYHLKLPSRVQASAPQPHWSPGKRTWNHSERPPTPTGGAVTEQEARRGETGTGIHAGGM